MKIAIVHPDLGIGGAEKLMIEVGNALISYGHSVTFFTSHYDPNHCFSETQDRRFIINCIGNWLPRSIFGNCLALCAYIRMLYLSLYLYFHFRTVFHAIFCDQISICIPILKASSRKVIFYCHFPDKLLTERLSLLKQYYRIPIDYLEEWTTGKADVVLVNSEFTRDVFLKSFPSLTHITPKKCYPSLNFDEYRVPSEIPSDISHLLKPFLFLSINRFERKKNISLAIRAFYLLSPASLSDLSLTSPQWCKCNLVIAGGYDERLEENVQYYAELVKLTNSLGLESKVHFLRSISSDVKNTLLGNCIALIYTPEFEHFGIVPLEAMYMKVPVIAHNSGGPKETVISGKTGFLCESGDKIFAQAMQEIVFNIDDIGNSNNFGLNGHLHVIKNFSFDKFAFNIIAFLI